MNWNRIRWGIIFCLAAVILGAFGAHTLKALIPLDRLTSFETGVRYQFYHGLALIVLGQLAPHLEGKKINWAMILIIAGTISFSGSIYLLACRDLFGWQQIGWLGPITPLGGTLMITGWFLVLLSTFRK